VLSSFFFFFFQPASRSTDLHWLVFSFAPQYEQ
jgi:hypothetical protein